MLARFCDPVVTDKGEFGPSAMAQGWIFTFPCHRGGFSKFDVAGVNFDVTRHRAGFQVTTWSSGGGGFQDIWSKYLGNSGFTKEILVAGRRGGGGSHKTLARRIFQ